MSFASLKFNPWSAGTVVLSIILMFPVLCVTYFAFESSGEIWRHLASTSLPIYVRNTITLMCGVGVLVFVIGAVSYTHLTLPTKA